ncbi:MAG: glycosyltransferase family 2 protein [Gammaproteobacteria bacterium]
MITVIVPAWNEEGAIEQTILGLQKVLDGARMLDAEIIVIDDGSSDRTGEIAAAAGATVHRHPHNVGYGRALKAGITLAKYDPIVFIDADLTYPVEIIPKLYEEYCKGYDMVVGARTGHYYEGGVLNKGPLRMILKFLVEFSAGRSIPDANSGLRILSKSTVTSYLNHLCDTFSFTTSITLAYMMTNRFVHYIPIEYSPRLGQTKVHLFKDSMLTLQYIVQSIIYYNPIKIFIVMSGLCILMSILFFLIGAITRLNAPYFLGIGGLLIAMLVFCLGLLADLLRQIMSRGT